jgi:hypothetical protein
LSAAEDSLAVAPEPVVVADGELLAEAVAEVAEPEAEAPAVSEEMKEEGIAAPAEEQSFWAAVRVSVLFMLEMRVSEWGWVCLCNVLSWSDLLQAVSIQL